MRRVLKWFVIVIATVVTLLALADAVWVFLPQVMAQRTIDDVDRYAQPISNIIIPDEVKIIGLGEATHGNAEFQELKLTVLKRLVEKENVRAFALEADFSEGLTINDYIHGGEGDATELAKQFSFSIYRTKQMAELIEWMREYNAGKPASQQLSFYGFDMQNPEQGVERVITYCQEHAILSSEDLEAALAPIKAGSVSKGDLQKASELLQQVQSAIETQQETKESQLMKQAILSMLNGLTYYQMDLSDYAAMNNTRDQYMADNVAWIHSFQEKNGSPRLLIAGHNGHVSYKEQFYNTMGSHLKDTYQKQYFVIGTDYFDTVVNTKTVGENAGRENHHFNSADPLAAQAKRMGGSYYLDFAAVPKDSPTGLLLSKPMSMGSVGEGYSFLMPFLPTTHRIQQTPKELYDAMIFCYQVHPIAPLTK